MRVQKNIFLKGTTVFVGFINTFPCTSVQGYARSCYQADLSFWETMKIWFSWNFSWDIGSCESYYKALMVDPFWEVNPLMVSALYGIPLLPCLTNIKHQNGRLFRAKRLNVCYLFEMLWFTFSYLHRDMQIVNREQNQGILHLQKNNTNRKLTQLHMILFKIQTTASQILQKQSTSQMHVRSKTHGKVVV